jgi:acyl dehydratase
MKFFEDFSVGERIKTRGRTITEADIVNFAAFSGDWYPLHVDAEFAKKSLFGERIAHGMLVLSATSGLMPLTDMAIQAFYGMDRVRFAAPTKIGDTLHVELEVLEKQDKGELGGVVTMQSNVRNQRGENAAVSTLKVLMQKQAGQQGDAF